GAAVADGVPQRGPAVAARGRLADDRRPPPRLPGAILQRADDLLRAAGAAALRAGTLLGRGGALAAGPGTGARRGHEHHLAGVHRRTDPHGRGGRAAGAVLPGALDRRDHRRAARVRNAAAAAAAAAGAGAAARATAPLVPAAAPAGPGHARLAGVPAARD